MLSLWSHRLRRSSAGALLAIFSLSLLSTQQCTAQPVARAPTPALLWECSAARHAAQAWTAPVSNGTISLQADPLLFLSILGWPFSRNTPVVVAAAAPNATSFAFDARTGALVATTGSDDAPPGACVTALFGVPFHGAGVGTSECASSGGAVQGWTYSTADGTLRPIANGSLCLDWGSSFDCAVDGVGMLYCDASAAPAARAADLALRLTGEEAAAVLSSGLIVEPLNFGTNIGLPARGLPPLWFSECCHGAVANCGAPGTRGGTGCATSLPAGLSTGASLNVSAWAAAGRLISTEARAFYNQGLHGLGCFAPNVNPFRAPQWGRGAEVVAEDPFVNAEFGVSFTNGLQGEGDASVLRVLATLKHGAWRRCRICVRVCPLPPIACCINLRPPLLLLTATAYDMEASDGASRSSFNARVSARDLTEYFFPPFRATAQRARPRFLMTSYNAVNGVPSCASEFFMNEVMRGDWGWQGATVTDCGGLQGVQTSHHYTNSTNETIAVALSAGLDSECGSWFATYGAAAVADGSVALAALQLAASRTLTSWFSVGLLTPHASQDPYAHLGPDDIDTPAARALALEMAVQGAALLRNGPARGGVPLLPLAAGRIKTLALIGPHATSTVDLLGPYSPPTGPAIANSSLAVALARRGAAEGFAVTVVPGCADTSCTSTSGFAAALAAAKAADVIVAAFGISGLQEGEGHDRADLGLPGAQEALLDALHATGVPLVLVLVHGGPLGLVSAADAAAYPAVLTLHYPGQAGGEAATRILFGDVSPSGRSLVTWYPRSFGSERLVIDMQLQPHKNSSGADVPGITYRCASRVRMCGSVPCRP